MINMYEIIYDESESKVGEEKNVVTVGERMSLWEEALEDPRGHGEHDIQNGIQNPREGS